MRRVTLLLGAVFVLAGCDPGWGIWVRNDSASRLIVQFLDYPEHGHGRGIVLYPYSYDPGVVGDLGSTSGPIVTVRVTTPDCGLVWEQTIRAHDLGVVVSAAGDVTWVEGSFAVTPSAEYAQAGTAETNGCLPPGYSYDPGAPPG